MADVRVKLQVDTAEAEAKLRVLERRVHGLNVRDGQLALPNNRLTDRGRVGTRGLFGSGADIIVEQAVAPTITKESLASNAALISGVAGGAAAFSVAGSPRGASISANNDILGPATTPSVAQIKDMRDNRMIKEHLNDFRFQQTAHRYLAAYEQLGLERAGRSGQMTLGALLDNARNGNFGNRANWNKQVAADILEGEKIWEAKGRIWKNRGMRLGGYAKAPFVGAWKLSGYFSKAMPSLAIAGKYSGALTLAALAGHAVSAVDTVIERDVRRNLETGNYRALDGATGKVLDQFRVNLLEGNAKMWQGVFASAAKVDVAIALAFGSPANARVFLEFADQISGALKDRNDKLSALQDAWTRGFGAAGDAGLQAARTQSTNVGYRAVALGLRGGDLLDIDKSVYHEIASEMRRRYELEYFDKVPYPKMSDVDGDK